MAKQKAGVYDRVLECAREEFLSKGFLEASLRTIAQAADTSTRLYLHSFWRQGGAVPGHCGAGGGSIQGYVPQGAGGFSPAQ